MQVATSGRINEPIQVCDKQYNYFPKVFRWRGETHHVRAVDRCWTKSQRRLLGKVERHCFRVRTFEATFELSQDLERDLWYLDRVLE